MTDQPGRSRVRIDMDPSGEVLSAWEGDLLVADDLALELQKDQAIAFSGEVDQAIDMLRALEISLNRATLCSSIFLKGPRHIPRLFGIARGVPLRSAACTISKANRLA
jgi:hypothetical protein